MRAWLRERRVTSSPYQAALARECGDAVVGTTFNASGRLVLRATRVGGSAVFVPVVIAVSARPSPSGSPRATVPRFKGNLFWAFAYNVAAIPLAVAGLLHR